MHKGIIASLILSVLLVIFALQNTHPVKLNLYFWSFESSLALLVVVLFVFGALLGYLLMIPTIYNKNKAIRQKDQQLKKKGEPVASVKTSNNKETDLNYGK